MAEPDQERRRRIAKMRGTIAKRLFRCMSCCVTGRLSSLSFSSAWVLRLLQQRSVMKRILIVITGFVCALALMICGVSVLSGFSTASEKKVCRHLGAVGKSRRATMARPQAGPSVKEPANTEDSCSTTYCARPRRQYPFQPVRARFVRRNEAIGAVRHASRPSRTAFSRSGNQLANRGIRIRGARLQREHDHCGAAA